MSPKVSDGCPPQGGEPSANTAAGQALRATVPYRRSRIAFSTAALIRGSRRDWGCTIKGAQSVPQTCSLRKATASSRKDTGSSAARAVSERIVHHGSWLKVGALVRLGSTYGLSRLANSA